MKVEEIESIEPIEPIETDYSRVLREYHLANQIKLKAEKEVKKFKAVLDSYMKELPTDTLGNSYFSADGLLLKRQATVRVAGFNEKAEELLKSKGVYNQFISLKYDKENIDCLIDAGVLNQEEVEKIVNIDIIYKSTVKEVEDGRD